MMDQESSEGIFDELLRQENEEGLGDPCSPEEDRDILLSPDDQEFLKKHQNYVPPVAEGKEISLSMLNFIRNVTKAYRLCYFQFVSFVDNTPGFDSDILGYCTRKNIDGFFANVISKRTTTAGVNRRFVAAIQRYAIYWEERFGFVVDSDVVKKALSDAKNCAKHLHATSNVHVDAHRFRPTKHTSATQENRMIINAFSCETTSKKGVLPLGINFLISWNCSMQGFTRGDEVRNCRLADLCHEVNYGPNRPDLFAENNNNTLPSGLLSMIQQPYNTKLMSSKARVVGFFRHKDWKRCATSVISFSIMARFAMMTPSELANLFAVQPDGKPNWYDLHLIDWREYDAMADTFRNFFADAEIDYTKLTHTRKIGIIRAHSLGADRENIILLSKHTTQRVDTSYLPELPYQAMLAAAGFDVFRGEEYYIPRSYAAAPVEWIDDIFPFYGTWKHQVNNIMGYDKGAAALNFVNQLLPFMAAIIAQDGIYLTSQFPNHIYSKLLLQQLGHHGYVGWANAQREEVHRREEILHQNRNEDRKYEAVLRTSERTALTMMQMAQDLQIVKSAISTTQTVQPQDTSVSFIRNSFSSTTEIPREATTASIVGPIQESLVEHLPSVPVIPESIHPTIASNMEWWLHRQYYKYLDRNVSLRELGWSKKVQQRFSKRKDIALWVKVVTEATVLNHKDLDWDSDSHLILQVANVLDEERQEEGHTVTQALEKFKAGSFGWIKNRKKRKNDV